MCLTSVRAQNSVEGFDSVLGKTSSLLLSNHQEKALEILVPLYYGSLEKGSTGLGFQELVYQYTRILERTEQHQDAMEVADKWIDDGSFSPFYKTRLSIVKALVYEKIGQPHQCVDELNKSKKAIAQNNWPALNAEYLVRRSSYHRVFGNMDSARLYALKALPAALQSGNQWHIADSYLLLGFTDNEPKTRYGSLRNALASYKALNDTDGIGFMYLNFYTFHNRKNEIGRAKAYIDSAGMYANGPNFINLKANYQDDLALYFENRKDYKNALEAFQRATDLYNMLAEQQNNVVLYNEKYKSDHLKPKELHQLKVLNKAERKRLTSERNSFVLFLVVLTVLLFLVLYLYVLRRKQGQTILNDQKTIQTRNSELEALLSHNELLLSELHHRVKNNLQFIISMISLQIESSESPTAKEVLESVLTRVGAIASVHEKLYQKPLGGKDLEQREFIRNILNNLHKFVNIDNVTININIEPFLLDTTRTIALGMIVTELVTNSQKHAFEGNAISDPIIDIRLKIEPDANMVIFDYQDNGPGTSDVGNEGMGIRLVRLFAKQLKGEPTMEFENGFKLRMKFPIEKYEG